MIVVFIGFIIFIGGLFTSYFSGFSMLLIQYLQPYLFVASRNYTFLALGLIQLLVLSLIVAIFFRKSKLKQRLPQKIPGYAWILAAVILNLAIWILYFLATKVEGGGAAFTVGALSVYVVIPAKIFLTIGIFKVLLAAKPQ